MDDQSSSRKTIRETSSRKTIQQVQLLYKCKAILSLWWVFVYWWQTLEVLCAWCPIFPLCSGFFSSRLYSRVLLILCLCCRHLQYPSKAVRFGGSVRCTSFAIILGLNKLIKVFYCDVAFAAIIFYIKDFVHLTFDPLSSHVWSFIF